MPVIDEEKIAAAQGEFDAALAGNDAAHEALVAAKEKCAAACTPLSEAVAATAEGTEERETAVWAEEEAHAEHAAELEAAYAAVGRLGAAEVNLRRAKRGFGPTGASNPAPQGETLIDAAIAVESGLITGEEPAEEA